MALKSAKETGNNTLEHACILSNLLSGVFACTSSSYVFSELAANIESTSEAFVLLFSELAYMFIFFSRRCCFASFRAITLTMEISRREAQTKKRHENAQTSIAFMYETLGKDCCTDVLIVVIVNTSRRANAT